MPNYKEILHVSVQSVSVSKDISNPICSNIKFENGAIATAINGNIGSGGYLKKWFFEIIGGSISATIVNYTKLVFSSSIVAGVENNEYHNGFNEQMDMFAKYVLEGSKSPMDVWEATLPTVIMEKAVDSVRNKNCESINIKEFLIPKF